MCFVYYLLLESVSEMVFQKRLCSMVEKKINSLSFYVQRIIRCSICFRICQKVSDKKIQSRGSRQLRFCHNKLLKMLMIDGSTVASKQRRYGNRFKVLLRGKVAKIEQFKLPGEILRFKTKL